MPDLDDELVNLELQPRARCAAPASCIPAWCGTSPTLPSIPRAVGADAARTLERQRSEFLKDAWAHGERFLRGPQAAYAARLRQANQPVRGEVPAEPGSQSQRFTQAPARRHAHACRRGALPGAVDRCRPPHVAQPQPAVHGHGDVGPGPRLVRASVARRSRSIPEQPERTALDLFDRLRLREPFAHAFAALGFEGEEAWRVAARIKVLLLIGAGVGKEQAAGVPPEPALSLPKGLASGTGEGKPESGDPASPAREPSPLAPALWLDPDCALALRRP